MELSTIIWVVLIAVIFFALYLAFFSPKGEEEVEEVIDEPYAPMVISIADRRTGARKHYSAKRKSGRSGDSFDDFDYFDDFGVLIEDLLLMEFLFDSLYAEEEIYFPETYVDGSWTETYSEPEPVISNGFVSEPEESYSEPENYEDSEEYHVEEEPVEEVVEESYSEPEVYEAPEETYEAPEPEPEKTSYSPSCSSCSSSSDSSSSSSCGSSCGSSD